MVITIKLGLKPKKIGLKPNTKIGLKPILCFDPNGTP